MSRLGFRGTVTRHFYFQNNKSKDILVHNTQPNCMQDLQLSVSYIFLEDMSARSLNAINIEFEHDVNNITATFHNKLQRNSKVRGIAQGSRESTWTNMEMMSFAPY